MDKPVADVSCAAGEVSDGGPRPSQEVRSSGSYSSQRVGPRYSRVDQSNLQYESRLLEGDNLVRYVVDIAVNQRQTEFYHGSSAKANGKIIYNLFSECDPIIHAQQKRPISQHYSLSGVLLLEPHVNEMTQYLCQRLEETFIDEHRATKTCNLGNWILFCMLSQICVYVRWFPSPGLMPRRHLGRCRKDYFQSAYWIPREGLRLRQNPDDLKSCHGLFFGGEPNADLGSSAGQEPSLPDRTTLFWHNYQHIDSTPS
jgi:hypothetical protein